MASFFIREIPKFYGYFLKDVDKENNCWDLWIKCSLAMAMQDGAVS